MSESATRYTEGDEVATPDGRGVVAAVLTDDFEFPQGGEDDYADVEASDDRPAYVVDEDVNGLDDLPEGWDRDSVLEYWSSIGGSWEECAEDLTDEFEEERAREHCSAMKDEVLRTQRWRNRF